MKKASAFLEKIQEQNNHDLDMLMEQHKQDIDSLNKPHNQELEKMEKDHSHKLEILALEHKQELERKEKEMQGMAIQHLVMQLMGKAIENPVFQTKMNEALENGLKQNQGDK